MDVHLCNAYTLALADRSPEYREILRGSALNLPDGMSVMWANQLLHRGQIAPRERVRGTDLFLNVVSAGNDKQLRHYLLGSTPDVLASLTNNLRKRCPAVLIVGSESPPFRDLTDRERRTDSTLNEIPCSDRMGGTRNTEAGFRGEPTRTPDPPRLRRRRGGVRFHRGEQARSAYVDATRRPGMVPSIDQRAAETVASVPLW